MDLSLSEEQQQIVDSAEGFLVQASAMSAVRAASESASGVDLALWRGMAELGWCGVHLPEDVGGLGLGLVELVLLQEQLGRRLACVPFFDSVALASTLLRELPEDPVSAEWLGQLASGEATASLAWPPVPSGERAHAVRSESGWVIHGAWSQVGSAASADVLLLPAHDECGTQHLFLLKADNPGLQVQPLETLDATRRLARVVGDNVVLPTSHCIADGLVLVKALDRTQQLAAIALAGEQVGVAQQCLDLTLAYTAQRHQFDRAIASFQAVKHRCAQMLVAVESARSAVYGAAAVADASPDPSRLLLHAAQARVAATEASQFCAREAIQLHGGVGFTWEFDPHLYLRRAQASSQRLGPLSDWLERAAAEWLDVPETLA